MASDPFEQWLKQGADALGIPQPTAAPTQRPTMSALSPSLPTSSTSDVFSSLESDLADATRKHTSALPSATSAVEPPTSRGGVFHGAAEYLDRAAANQATQMEQSVQSWGMPDRSLLTPAAETADKAGLFWSPVVKAAAAVTNPTNWLRAISFPRNLASQMALGGTAMGLRQVGAMADTVNAMTGQLPPDATVMQYGNINAPEGSYFRSGTLTKPEEVTLAAPGTGMGAAAAGPALVRAAEKYAPTFTRGAERATATGATAPAPELLADASRPAPLKSAANLDMSTEARMRRAQEMGFDTNTPLYHGSYDARGIRSSGGFERRTRNAYNVKTGAHEEVVQPVYLATDRRTASTYANDHRAFDYQNAEPEVIEAYARSGNPLEINAYSAKFSELPVSAVREQLPKAQQAAFDDILATYPSGTNKQTMRTGDMEIVAQKLGYDGFVLRNVKDTYDGRGKPTTVYAVFDPARLRAPNAAFNPAQRASANLLASDASRSAPVRGAMSADRRSMWREAAERLKNRRQSASVADPQTATGPVDEALRADPRLLERGGATPEGAGDLSAARAAQVEPGAGGREPVAAVADTGGEARTPAGQLEPFRVGNKPGYALELAPIEGARRRMFRTFRGGTDLDYLPKNPQALREIARSDPRYLTDTLLIQRPGAGDDAWEVVSTSTRKDERGQGHMSRAYDQIERDMGITLHPSGTLTADGKAFWEKRRPGSTQYHQEVDGQFYSPQMLWTLKTIRDINARQAAEAGDMAKVRAYLKDAEAINAAIEKIPPGATTVFSDATASAGTRSTVRARAERLMQEATNLERSMAGQPPEQIAKAFREQLGLSVKPEDIASGNTWWRVERPLGQMDLGRNAPPKGMDIESVPAPQAEAPAPRGLLERAGNMTPQQMDLAIRQLLDTATPKTGAGPMSRGEWNDWWGVLNLPAIKKLSGKDAARVMSEMTGKDITETAIYQARQTYGPVGDKKTMDRYDIIQQAKDMKAAGKSGQEVNNALGADLIKARRAYAEQRMKEGATYREIAEELGVWERAVRKYMTQSPRATIGADEASRILAMAREGKSGRQIAKELGRDQSTVARFLQRNAALLADATKSAWERAAAKGLNMSHEARMERARQMGFDTDTPVYSGRYRDFEAWWPDRTGYWTEDPDYASVYTSPRGSSLGKSGTHFQDDISPNIVKGYIKRGELFDTRKPEHRRIFDEEFTPWGSNAPLTENKLPDWTDVENFREFAEEKGLPFKGIVVDEGGVPMPDGTVKWRGASYATFDPSIARSVNAAFDPDNAKSATLLASDASKSSGVRSVVGGIEGMQTAPSSVSRSLKGGERHLGFGDKLAGHTNLGTGMEDADFWIVRRGTPDAIGKPTKEYNPEHIGVKVRNHQIDPDYLYYALQHVHGQGYYKGRGHGTTRLQNIKVGDVADVPIQASDFKLFSRTDQSAGVRSAMREVDDLGYYSKALEAARAWPQGKGTPEQALTWLKKSGVKDAEIEATGIGKTLEGQKSITRDDLIKGLEEGQATLTERQNWQRPESYDRDAASEAKFGRPYIRLNRDEKAAIDKAAPGKAKWSSYSLDPSNPTYRETVLHLPPNNVRPSANGYWEVARGTGRPDVFADEASARAFAIENGGEARPRMVQQASDAATDFRSGHFDEPNIVGHMMTSETINPKDGGKVFTIDQIQSDWGQRLREGGVRDEAKIARLQGELAAVREENRKMIARIQERGWSPPDGSPIRWAEARGHTDIVNDINRLTQEDMRLGAELQVAQAATPGNPLVNTTDQWVNTTLRRALKQAVDAKAEYIAIPSGDTVLGYNPGDTQGMRGFYGDTRSKAAISAERDPLVNIPDMPSAITMLVDQSVGSKGEGIVPKNLRKLLEKMDKSAAKPEIIETLDSPSGKTGLGKGFTLFKITDAVRKAVNEGQPLFSKPVAAPRSGGRDDQDFDPWFERMVDKLGLSKKEARRQLDVPDSYLKGAR